MLAWWTELLPLFIVRILAKPRCERVSIGGEAWVIARPDVLVKFINSKERG